MFLLFDELPEKRCDRDAPRLGQSHQFICDLWINVKLRSHPSTFLRPTGLFPAQIPLPQAKDSVRPGDYRLGVDPNPASPRQAQRSQESRSSHPPTAHRYALPAWLPDDANSRCGYLPIPRDKRQAHFQRRYRDDAVRHVGHAGPGNVSDCFCNIEV
jgi:hypothetical protein